MGNRRSALNEYAGSDTAEQQRNCRNCDLPDCWGMHHPACPNFNNNRYELDPKWIEKSRYLASLGYKTVTQAVVDLVADGMGYEAVAKLLRIDIQTCRQYWHNHLKKYGGVCI